MRFVFLTLLAVGSLSADDLKLISDVKGQHICYRSFVGDITEGAFELMASELLGSPEVSLGALAAYGSLSEHVLAGPRGFDHCGYGHWRAVIDGYEKSLPGCPRVKEATKIGSGIIIRTVDRDCQRSTKVLQGKGDPLHLQVTGVNIEVMEMAFAPLASGGNEDQVVVHLYARTDGSVSVELAKALAAEIRDSTGAREIGVELRSDKWFITDCGFPALFPFENLRGIPSADEFSQTKYAYCGLFGSFQGEIRCFEGMSHP